MIITSTGTHTTQGQQDSRTAGQQSIPHTTTTGQGRRGKRVSSLQSDTARASLGRGRYGRVRVALRPTGITRGERGDGARAAGTVLIGTALGPAPERLDRSGYSLLANRLGTKEEIAWRIGLVILTLSQQSSRHSPSRPCPPLVVPCRFLGSRSSRPRSYVRKSGGRNQRNQRIL